MQKFIRIVLPCVCFAVIIWWCCFNGFQYIHWKWLILAAGIGAVCYIGTINRYIYGRMCIDFGKKHSILIRGYWHRVLCNELHRLLCAYLDQRAFQLDIIRNNKDTN